MEPAAKMKRDTGLTASGAPTGPGVDHPDPESERRRALARRRRLNVAGAAAAGVAVSGAADADEARTAAPADALNTLRRLTFSATRGLLRRGG